ncbi:MAG: hypothetical protein JWQ64_3626 [Subtercola sp.]|nr:hypothetical protein [Subtercola sp.]
MRILLLNVNTNATITARLAEAARRAASADTVIEATQPTWGVSSVEGVYDAYISVAAGLDRVHQLLGRSSVPLPDTGYEQLLECAPGHVPARSALWDALIWGGFGDPGADAFGELLAIPAFDLATAAAREAAGRRYVILTTVGSMRPLIVSVLASAGVAAGCVGIADLGASVTSVGGLPESELIAALAHLAVATPSGKDAECFLLGSAALAGLAPPLAAALGRPVIDGAQAAVRLAEAGASTIDLGTHRFPAVKARPGWPVSAPPIGLRPLLR